MQLAIASYTSMQLITIRKEEEEEVEEANWSHLAIVYI